MGAYSYFICYICNQIFSTQPLPSSRTLPAPSMFPSEKPSRVFFAVPAAPETFDIDTNSKNLL